MDAIEINRITMDYGNHKGVFDVSFSVKKGEIMGFLGPNGAGKTTTIRQLLGFTKPESGTVKILGMDSFKEADKIAKHTGYLPGEITFIDSMNGMEFIRFVAGMKGMKDLGRAPELIQRFELDTVGMIKKMSKGMKQKMGIVCAFMQDPEILILDEPTSGLDPLMQNVFVELLMEEKERGKTVLMSSHIFEEVEKTCDRVAIIRNGKLMSVENIEKLKNSRSKTLILKLKDAEDALALCGKYNELTGQMGSVDETQVTLSVRGNMDALIKLISQFTVSDMEIHTQSLEELFMHFYGGENHD